MCSSVSVAPLLLSALMDALQKTKVHIRTVFRDKVDVSAKNSLHKVSLTENGIHLTLWLPFIANCII